MNIRDYLFDPTGKDWNKLLGYWRPLVPENSNLWFVNLLGEVFFAGAGGPVSWLIVGTGRLEEVAPTREQFAKALDAPGNANRWLRTDLIEKSRAAGMKLSTEECFGFRVPPLLLGEYAVSNLQPTNIYSHYSWLAHMSRQDEIYWTGD